MKTEKTKRSMHIQEMKEIKLSRVEGRFDKHMRERNMSRMNTSFLTCTIQRMVVLLTKTGSTAVSLRGKPGIFTVNFRYDKFEEHICTTYLLFASRSLSIPFTV